MRRALILLLFAPVVVLGQTVTLKHKVKVGDTAKYRITFVFTVYGNDVFYTATETDKVTDVQKDGSYTVESIQTDIHAGTGKALPVVQNPAPSTTTYSARGMVLDLHGDQAQESWRDAYMSSFVLPDKPIAKGDTWTVHIDPRADRVTPGSTFIFTNAGSEPDKVDDANVIRIEEKFTETTLVNPATSTGTIWVNPSDGSIVKLDEQWYNAPILGLSTLVNGHVSYERIP